MAEENQNLGVQSHAVSSFFSLCFLVHATFAFSTPFACLGLAQKSPFLGAFFVSHSLYNPAVPLMLAANLILALTAY